MVISRRYQRMGLALSILGLAFGLRLYRLDFQSIWWDEGHSIFVASQPISQIPTLPAMDVHPPAYFWLLHGWMMAAGRSEFALRFLSVSFSLLTVALMWRFGAGLARALKPDRRSSLLPLLAALLAAVSPLYVAYAQEVRSYAMITFLALADTFVLWRLLLAGQTGGDTGKTRGRLLLVYVGLMAACLYTHYFTIFLLFFHNLVWLVWLLRGKFARHYAASTMMAHAGLWAASQAGILLLFMPQLLLAVRQISSYTNPNLMPPTLTYFIGHSWQAYTVGLTNDPTPARWTAWAMAAVLVASWSLYFVRHAAEAQRRKGAGDTGQVAGSKPQGRTVARSQDRRLPFAHSQIRRFAHAPMRPFASPQSAIRNSSRITHHASRITYHFLFLLTWLALPLLAYFLVLQRQPSFEPRYLMLVTPALFLLLALGLALLHDLAGPVAFYGGTLVVMGALLTGLYSVYTNERFFKDDSAGVAAWLARETTPQDIVYVDVPHPFHYYVEQAHIPAPVAYLFVDIHTAAERLNQEAAGRRRLFWVTWRGSDTDPRGVIPFLAEKAGEPAGQRDFKGYQVSWYALPARAEFSLPAELPPGEATFGDVLRLEGAAFSPAASPDEPAWATLRFRLLRDTAIDYRVSLRLRGAGGQLAGQVDRDLLNDRHFRTSAWPPADPQLNQAVNVYLLPVAPDAPPGEYRLEAVVYDAQPPYPSEGVSSPTGGDGAAAIIGTVTIGTSDN